MSNLSIRIALLSLKQRQLMIRADAASDKHKWITTETGSHIKVDGEGNIVAGAGGKFNGKPLSAMGGTKKFTKYQTNAERAETAKKSPAAPTNSGAVSEQPSGEQPQKKPTRLEVLQNSLKKKEDELNRRLDNHFTDVKSANGQPLNDKRNGQATFNRWEKQNNSIKNQLAEIEKTKNAIDYHESKQKTKAYYMDKMNDTVKNMVSNGTLKQWGKYPDHFFVDGVDKARIIIKDGVPSHKYLSEIPKGTGQFEKFRDTYNEIYKNYKESQAAKELAAKEQAAASSPVLSNK